jgi:hypothetical protein
LYQFHLALLTKAILPAIIVFMGVSESATPGLAKIQAVEVFSTGRHQSVVWTPEKLDQAVANFTQHQLPGGADKTPPLVIGHSEDQKLMKDSGYPAVGRPSKMWREDVPCRLCKGTCKAPQGVEAYDESGSCPICLGTGTQGLILADLDQVPRSIAKLINARAYDNVSSEMVENAPPQVPMTGANLRRIALLGGKLPHIKTLSDLPQADYEGFGEDVTPDVILRPMWCEKTPDGVWECFSEVIPEKHAEPNMREDWAKKLLAYGHKKEHIERMDEGMMADTCAVHEARDKPKYEHGDKSDKEWSEHEPKHEAMEAYAEMCHKHVENHVNRGKKIFGPHFSMDKVHHTEVRHHSHSEANMAEKFSEEDRKAIVAAVVAQIKGEVEPLKKDVADFKTATRDATKAARIEAFCERMKVANKVAPHELDATAVQTNPRFRTLPQRLMMLDDVQTVEKFSEGGKEISLTRLDLEMSAIEARPPQRYGELSRGGTAGAVVPAGQDVELHKVQLHYEAFSEVFKKLNTSKEEFVGGFLNNRKYDETITADKYLNPVAGKN